MALLTPVLQLGDFEFLSFEQPMAVQFGKVQLNFPHLLIGGGKVVDLLGAYNPDILLTGFFTGAQAQFRARFLEGLVKAGNPLQLKTAAFVKTVAITDFRFDFRFVFPISYTMTLQVIEDDTQPVNIIVPGDITNTVVSALIEAQDIATLIANPSVTNAIALALLAAQEAAPFDQASDVQINAAISAASAAQTAISQAISAAQSGAFS